MVLAYHGKQVPLDELRQMTSTNRDGVDALAMTQASQRYGLRARGVAADVDDLEHLPPATILHWEFAHFVVFERLRRNGVQVVDPAVGRRRLSLEVFRRSYTGVAITFEPGEDFQTSKLSTKGTWRYLRPLLGQSRRLTRVLVGSVLLRLLALSLPLVTGLLVDVIVPRNDRHLLLVTGATMGAVVAATARTTETTSGPALINVQERTFVALVPGAASPDLQRGQLVRLQVDGLDGRPLAARVLRAEVADQADIRRAGFASSSQPAMLVTGVLEPHADVASLPSSPRHEGRAVVVLRSPRILNLFLRQLRGTLRKGGDS